MAQYLRVPRVQHHKQQCVLILDPGTWDVNLFVDSLLSNNTDLRIYKGVMAPHRVDFVPHAHPSRCHLFVFYTKPFIRNEHGFSRNRKAPNPTLTTGGVERL